MNWNNFNTHDGGPTSAFETLNNQLFERYIARTYTGQLTAFRVINGSGGDGGIEAYAQLATGDIIAVQSKWFRTALQDNEIKQIKKSIITAMDLRSNIKEYIICVPHDVNSVKIGRGKVATTNHEENKINELVDEINALYPNVTLKWWFDNELLAQLQMPGNEGILKFWFEREIISVKALQNKFGLQKAGLWLRQRYVPNLNSDGTINREYQKLICSPDFRDQISEDLDQSGNKITHCRKLVRQFIKTTDYPEALGLQLEEISTNLDIVLEELNRINLDVTNGSQVIIPKELDKIQTDQLINELEKIAPTHTQKPILNNLIEYLRELDSFKLPDIARSIQLDLNQKIRFFLGRAGTGKTQGLANATEIHLGHGMPAIIINAKETPSADWTVMLSTALELSGWNVDEIFTALETMSHVCENKLASSLPPGTDTLNINCNVLISIDGLEEDISKQEQWCSRMSETTVLTQRYPRLRFMFSARDYFERSCIVEPNNQYEIIELAWQGDVPISQVADDYLREYRIKISDLALIKGLDSLFGLRLFCEFYAGKEINSSDELVTATRELLRLKVERINSEFLAGLQNRKGLTEQPVFDALLSIAESFYSTAEIKHSVLKQSLMEKLRGSLEPNEVELLMDFLAQNGILTRENRPDTSHILPRMQHFYQITYQSIIDHILSEKLYLDVASQAVPEIPALLLNDGNVPNLQVIQSIATRLFIESGKLIGTDGVLATGLSPDIIQNLRLAVLIETEADKAIVYKEEIDNNFFGGAKNQFLILKNLIIPTAIRGSGFFGAEYLHDILASQRSAFERDKLWSGLDRFEQFQTEEGKIFKNNLKMALNFTGEIIAPLSEYHTYNELPLIYAWGLTNIDRELREALRFELATWSFSRPEEFIKLLDKVFSVGDPQMQEDLASITLGISGHLDDKDSLAALAKWAITNIFDQKAKYRNVIVRQGFRAIVEKSALAGAIPTGDAEIARPAKLNEVEMLRLEFPPVSGKGDEVYPIVHDLAWYVIGKAYDNFLVHPQGSDAGPIDRDCPEAKALLNLYRKEHKYSDLFASSWAMAAAIGYIRHSLGFTRTSGNGSTDETHGSKSRVYTYEEKYTWLAVHYLQGYLSDYVPIGDDYSPRHWVTDYSKLTEIPNPGEKLLPDDYYAELIDQNINWVITENLAGTIVLTGDAEANIRSWVREEPTLDFSKWLMFTDNDFTQSSDEREWLAIHGDTALHEASNAGYSRLTSKAIFIKKDEFTHFIDAVQSEPDDIHFLSDIEHIKASPDTHTYANPSDIIWMDWIEELDSSATFFAADRDIKVFYAVTEVTKGDLEGEQYFNLPSKIVRHIMQIKSLKGTNLYDSEGKMVGFLHKITDGSYRDRQEITLVDRHMLEKALDDNGLKLCWAVEFFKKKNPLNDALNQYAHEQRTRKYLVWEKDGIFNSVKFWDAYYSNRRDKIID